MNALLPEQGKVLPFRTLCPRLLPRAGLARSGLVYCTGRCMFEVWDGMGGEVDGELE